MAEGISGFRARRESDGRIILEPFAEIPARETWLFENNDALTSVRQGLEQSAAGKTTSLGSFEPQHAQIFVTERLEQ